MLRDTVSELLTRRPIPADEITIHLSMASSKAAPQDLQVLVDLAKMGDPMDQWIAYPAIALLPAWGIPAIDFLRELIADGPHSSAAQSTLMSLAMGEKPQRDDLLFLPDNWEELALYDLDSALVEHAMISWNDLIVAQATDEDLRFRIFWNFASDLMKPTRGPKHQMKQDFFLSSLVDIRLMLNRELIDEFSGLLDSAPDKEEELQQFLFEHPIILDPLAVQIISKHELGADFQTDFVIRRVNNEYVLVEIEKSTDRIFTQSTNFHSQLTESLGQVTDFQAWVSDNIAFARSKLPGIHRPEGLLVIGRNTEFDERLSRKLTEENFSRRGHVKIVTYDDLLERADAIYRNLISRPIRVKGKEQV